MSRASSRVDRCAVRPYRGGDFEAIVLQEHP
jgi:hypothetical protein